MRSRAPMRGPEPASRGLDHAAIGSILSDPPSRVQRQALVPAERDVAAVAAAVERVGLPEDAGAPAAAASVALAVIESVWSIGVRAQRAGRGVACSLARRGGEGA